MNRIRSFHGVKRYSGGLPQLLHHPDSWAMSHSAHRFYYGWVNVCVAALAMSATLPGRTYGLGLVKEPIRAELGIGDVEFGLLNFWAITIGAAVVFPAGRMIDRLGARGMLVLVTGLLGASVLAMSARRMSGNWPSR